MMSLSLIAMLGVVAHGANRTVVITGATGRSGSDTYLLLKKQGFNVRGLVRNVTKARDLLGCTKCDESEGIFVGDITNEASLAPAMKGADSLLIATGIDSGEKAKEIIFDGVENQVLFISMKETTLLDTFWNKILAKLWGGWQNGFYALNAEAFIMNANVPYTIIKCCGLDDTAPGLKKLLVGHDDKTWSMTEAHGVSRNDVARVLASAVANPGLAANTRFDFCSEAGTPQADATDVLRDAMYPWDPRKTKTSDTLLI